MDAFTTALTLLSRRELSVAQLRARLTRRAFAPDEVEAAIARLLADRTLDDRRVALASARYEASIRGRGRRRATQRLLQLGIDPDVARDAVGSVFSEVDETALVDAAIARRLRGRGAASLDAHAKARLVRALAAQGFDPSDVLRRLRSLGRQGSDEGDE